MVAKSTKRVRGKFNLGGNIIKSKLSPLSNKINHNIAKILSKKILHSVDANSKSSSMGLNFSHILNKETLTVCHNYDIQIISCSNKSSYISSLSFKTFIKNIAVSILSCCFFNYITLPQPPILHKWFGHVASRISIPNITELF